MNKPFRKCLEVLLLSSLITCTDKEAVNKPQEIPVEIFYVPKSLKLIYLEDSEKIFIQETNDKDSTSIFIVQYIDYDKDWELDEIRTIRKKADSKINDSSYIYNKKTDKYFVELMQNKFLSHLLYFQ